MNTRSNNQSFKHFSKQSGWTFWSLTFTLGVILFFAYVGMQLVPVYSTNRNIVNAMEQSVVGVDLQRVTRRTILENMRKQLYLDGSHKLLDYKNDISMSRSSKTFNLTTDYERIVPLFFNISVQVHFDQTLECEFTGRCYMLADRLKVN